MEKVDTYKIYMRQSDVEMLGRVLFVSLCNRKTEVYVEVPSLSGFTGFYSQARVECHCFFL